MGTPRVFNTLLLKHSGPRPDVIKDLLTDLTWSVNFTTLVRLVWRGGIQAEWSYRRMHLVRPPIKDVTIRCERKKDMLRYGRALEVYTVRSDEGVKFGHLVDKLSVHFPDTIPVTAEQKSFVETLGVVADDDESWKMVNALWSPAEAARRR
ncbi:hypothetical protein LTR86_002670 [Recurvomyces mirabilis]|nr:hypothetical protein LTR86_002670 [Recurvomyces mirabilis]